MVVVPTMPSDEAAISELFALWFRAMEAGDINSCLELVTDDVVSKPPMGPATNGRNALRRRLQAFHEHAAEQVDHEIIEVQVSGDLAYAWGAERANVQPFDRSEVSIARGVHLAVLRRQPDGTWRIAREIASLE